MSKPTVARKTIHAFVRTTRLRRRLWFTLASLATHGLFVGVVLYLIGWAMPSIYAPALWIGLSWLAVILAWHLLHPGLSLRAADGSLGLQDRLLTWWSLRDRDAEPAFRWLEDDLSHSLADLPAAARAQLWRRPVRRLLWALPLLLVVWIIGPIGRQNFLPSPFGVTRSGERGSQANAQGLDGDTKVAGRPDPNDEQPGKRDPDPSELPQPKRPDPTKPDPEKPPAGTPPPGKPDPGKPEPPQDPRSEPPLPPKPLLPLPGTEEFVIPSFVGEGDGKQQKTRVAVLEENDPEPATGSGAPPKNPAARTPGERIEARALEFRRAEERALRSRHVPAKERGIVKRYFAELTGGPAKERVREVPR